MGQILARSRAKLLFVGAPGIFERLDEVVTDVPVISFLGTPPDKPPARPALSWTVFLARGSGIAL